MPRSKGLPPEALADEQAASVLARQDEIKLRTLQHVMADMEDNYEEAERVFDNQYEILQWLGLSRRILCQVGQTVLYIAGSLEIQYFDLILHFLLNSV